MPDHNRQVHWDDVYATKGEDEVSWFQEEPALSLELIGAVGAGPGSSVIDIGGGASRLVDNLIDRGFDDVTVLDLSHAGLVAAKARLRSRAARVQWIVADVTVWDHRRPTMSGMIAPPCISSPTIVIALPM
jgi:hypothetical protein